MMPKWIEDHLASMAVDNDGYAADIHRALAIAVEALENIQKHQKTLMNDSGLVMSTTYTISSKALNRIEALGK